MEWLDYLGQFTNQENRLETARKFAELFNAEDLIIFLKDPELNVLLPGIGFPQSLPDGKRWQSFLKSSENAVYKGHVPYRDEICPAVAVRGEDSAIAVLIGGHPGDKDIVLLAKMLNITAPLLKQEQRALLAESKAMHSVKLAEKAEKLTTTLDNVRQSLMEVIKENSDLLQLTRRQNEELAAANEELRASNEEVMAGIEELNTANQKLLSINADLDNFIYTASHDLKAPVSNIEGLVNMLTVRLSRKDWEDGTTRKIMAMINSSVKRFKETLGDLTEIIKTEKESAEQRESVNLLETINDVKSDLYIPIVEAKAEIVLDVDKNVDIVFSRKNLKSIIYNLLSNAIKYKEAGRKPLVLISLKEEENFFVLSVKDNGMGMNTNDENKIFGLFKRLHNHVEGTGIGLYIIKKVIESGGGRIELDSALGERTTFWVYFKK